MSAHTSRGYWAALSLVIAWAAAPCAAAQDKGDPNRPLEERAFSLPELGLTSRHAPLDELLERLPNRAAWRAARAQGAPIAAFIDPRSGAASNLIVSVPLIPGAGVGNSLTLADLGQRLGRAVAQVDEAVVGELARRFVLERRALLGVDPAQLGAPRVTRVSEVLWQAIFPQEKDGLRVRDALLVVSISHGNVVLLGTQRFGRVNVHTRPSLSAEQALEAGFETAGGRSAKDDLLREPRLELIATDVPGAARDAAYAGPVGAGYRHRLVWSFAFQRAPELAAWEMLVDAHDGRTLSLRDTNRYAVRPVRGGAYPLTSSEQCPTTTQCGVMAGGTPMPFADTGLLPPNDFANSAGLFHHTSGSPVTTLTGRYFAIDDTCGSISLGLNRAMDIELGGINGQHDCDFVGTTGNTPAARSAYYHLNRIAEQARGWLPTNAWLQTRVTVNTNINLLCNSFWGEFSHTLNFYRSGTVNNPVQPTCRNTGEIAGFADHEWGHGLDQFDANGVFSSSTEAYADIAALYRLNASCIGHGFVASFGADIGCGLASDGSPNRNEAKVDDLSHCATNCSGLREADYLLHEDGLPDTPLNFVCGSCKTPDEDPSICGREAHCAAAPVRQAAWDLVARDLQKPPFSLNPETALLIGTRLFFQGSGAVGEWHACTCGNPNGGSSSGCGAANGYMQWLVADDDNGNLNDGTPHMTALHAAFDRHGIACNLPAPVNSGCAGGPSAAPVLGVVAGSNSATLSWTLVSGASQYWVFRSDGNGGCSLGKTLIGAGNGLSNFVDTQVVNGRQYHYNVVARGLSPACHGRTSQCKTVTPVDNVPPNVAIIQPVNDVETLASSWNITASAGDDVGVSKVEFWVNNVLKVSDSTAPYTYALSMPSVGLYTIVAKARDEAGNVTASAPRLIERLDPNNPLHVAR